jgi:hypothetical protein
MDFNIIGLINWQLFQNLGSIQNCLSPMNFCVCLKLRMASFLSNLKSYIFYCLVVYSEYTPKI